MDLKKFFFFVFLGLSLWIFQHYDFKKHPPHSPVQTLHLAIWSGVIPKKLLREFQKKTGVSVQVSYYSTNEEFLAKLQAGMKGYDLALVTHYIVPILKKLDLIEAIEWNQISARKALKKEFFSHPDAIPYAWGVTGIAINRKLFSGQVQTWKDLFLKKELKGKFSLLDDARELIGSALKALGYSLNSTNVKQLQEAQALLIDAKTRVKAFTNEPKMALVHHEVAIVQIAMSDALQAKKKLGETIEVIYPEEGSAIWVENLVIPKGAKNLKAAYLLVNFLMQAENGLLILENLSLLPVYHLSIPPHLKKNPFLFPPHSFLEKSEWFEEIGPAIQEWNKTWIQIKVS